MIMNSVKLPSVNLLIILLFVVLSSACSMNKMLVRGSLPMIEGGITALNKETDLELAEAAIPMNLEMLEGMLVIDPENEQLHTIAAQAYYGYAYGFTENRQPERASKLYIRGLNHGITVLTSKGLSNIKQGPLDQLEKALARLDDNDVAALFWTASNWAKWIDLNRDSTESIMQLPRATALMQRVLELDERFFHGSPHMYFGVYYGGRSPMFGGDFEKSEQHFDQARKINQNKLLVVDLLQAEYLERQRFNRENFHRLLSRIVDAPVDLLPELSLLNEVARRKAKLLLNKEDQWF